MLNKLKFITIITIALILFTTVSVAAEAEVTINALTRTDREDVYTSNLIFKDYVEGASDGRIEVVLHHWAPIGSVSESAELVDMGEYDMMAFSNEEAIVGYIPEIEAVNMPFLIDNQRIGAELWDGPYFKEVQNRLLSNSNLRLLGVSKNSVRRSYFKDPIRTPSGLEEYGLTMRTMEVPMHVEVWEATGADVVTVSSAERYEAMDTGMIGGLEGGIASTRDAGLFPLINYIVMTDHMMSFSYILANENFFQDLPEDLQEIVAEGVQMMTWEHRGLASQASQEVLLELSDEFPHIEVLYLTGDELNAWEETVRPVAESFLLEVAGEEFLEYTRQQVEEAAERLRERRGL